MNRKLTKADVSPCRDSLPRDVLLRVMWAPGGGGNRIWELCPVGIAEARAKLLAHKYPQGRVLVCWAGGRVDEYRAGGV